MKIGRFLVLLSIVVFLGLGTGSAAGEDRWVEVTPAPVGSEIEVEVREVAGGLIVELDLSGFYVEGRTSERDEFTFLKIPGCGGGGTVGEPHLPFRSIMIPVVNGPKAELSVVASDSAVALSGVTVIPAQPPVPDCGSGSPEFAIDDKAYAMDRWYPARAARIADDVVVRGQRFLVVEASPLSFNPVRGEVSVWPQMTFAINLTGPVDEAAEIRKTERQSLFFRTSAKLEERSTPRAMPTGIEYLIIADDSLVAAVGPLADWKRRKGFTVEIVPMSLVGSSSAELKAFLQTRYNADPDLTYVLLAGDHPAVPSEDVGGGMVSDLYYSCLDGSDYFPDIVMGRIAVQSVTDCEHVVDKILTYERDTVPGGWQGDYLMAAYFQDYSHVCQAERFFFETGTHAMHFIRDEVGMGIHTSATSDTLTCSPYVWRENATWYPHRFPGYENQPVPQVDAELITTASIATQNITDAINSGVGLVQHRDHGGETGWGDPPFFNSHVNALSNGTMTPVIYSINCLTGTFNMSGDCFAEAFMKKYPGGAVGVMAATDLSYSGHNDLLVHGAYDSFWDSYDTNDGGNVYPHSFRPAEAYLYGKAYMHHWQGHGSTTQLEFELFHWHGDPEMRVFTEVPATPGVSVDPTIPVGSPNLTVAVDVEGAFVAVTESGALMGRAEVVGGVAIVPFNPELQSPGTLDVVVTGHNLVPWQGTVEVIEPVGPWMAHRSHFCDDAAGNDDGIANPGETIVIPVIVENIGADGGTGITGLLSSGSPHCSVADPVADFPDAAAGALVQSLPDHFAVTVAASAPNGHTAALNLDWGATGGYVGATVFTLPICEPLVISDVAVEFAGDASAVVTWTTNVPAQSEVTFGTSSPPSNVVAAPLLTTAHRVELTGLDRCTDYIFEVESASPGCYTMADSNGGSYFVFTTSGGAPLVEDAPDTPVAIPDNEPAGASSMITVVSDYDVIDVDVLVDITHTYTGDLELLLIGPDGTSVMLSDRHGGTGENFIDTHFDDEASLSISGASAPFTGSFIPDGPLAALDGQPASGVWTFKVIDRAGYDTGNIEGWQLQLTVNEPCPLGPEIFSDDFEGGGTAAWSNSRP